MKRKSKQQEKQAKSLESITSESIARINDEILSDQS
jgi:hypothetical protein